MKSNHFLHVKSKLFGTLPLVGSHHLSPPTTTAGISLSITKGPTATKSTAEDHTATESRATAPGFTPLLRAALPPPPRAAHTTSEVSFAATSLTAEGHTIKEEYPTPGPTAPPSRTSAISPTLSTTAPSAPRRGYGASDRTTHAASLVLAVTFN